jgi:hypothetical protein
LQINGHEWRRPDYAQILWWADALDRSPQWVVDKLRESYEAEALLRQIFSQHFPAEFCMGRFFPEGMLLDVFLENFRIPEFHWVSDLRIRFLKISYTSSDWGDAPSLKNILRVRRFPRHQLLSLDFPPVLKALELAHLQVAELDLSKLQRLMYLSLESTRWHRLWLPTGAEVKILHLRSAGKLQVNDIAETFRSLQVFDCSSSEVDELDVSNLTELRNLQCRGCKARSILLPSSQKLEVLDCSRNEIASLDLTQAPDLRELNCKGNPIATLDVRPLRGLKVLCFDPETMTLIKRDDQSF